MKEQLEPLAKEPPSGLPEASSLIDVGRELHKLLWMKATPLRSHGAYDDGWNCRDHAFILGAALACLGVEPELVHGRAMFVRGECSGRPPVSLGLEPHFPPKHTWLQIPNWGIIDLSPNLISNDRGWPTVAFDGIIGSTWHPVGKGTVFVCTDSDSYEQEIAIGTHQGCEVRAVYWPVITEHLNAEMFRLPFKHVHSRIGQRLEAEYDRRIYLMAIQHIADRLRGSGRSLAGVSQAKAWRIIASRPAPPDNTPM